MPIAVRALGRVGAPLITIGALLCSVVVTPRAVPTAAAASQTCDLANGIEHVFYIQFDNTHLRRDLPDVPSDLERMPHLLSFMRDNGTLLSNDHTILISHTGGGFVSSLTGLYPDRNGISVSNNYGYFSGVGSSGISFGSVFRYWTDLVDGMRDPPTDGLTNMVTDGGKNTPAPWVPFTRAGCDVGGIGFANIELETNGTGPHGDMTEVFGAKSPEWTEVATDATSTDPKVKAQPSADFVGLAVHCARGGICDQATGARPDRLPDEPGGYTNFTALFGAKYIDPVLTRQDATVPVTDLFGQPIVDAQGNAGFPGFERLDPNVSLAYAAAMQEAGVQVTYSYISDAHDDHSGGGFAFGPGEDAYQGQLQSYDQAFASFFDNLSAHGITRDNSLFVFTVDEGDHFAGGTSSDGTWAHQVCNLSVPDPSCPPNQIGEIDANIFALLPPDSSRPTFAIHNDSAPTFYVSGQPSRDTPAVRNLERDVANLTLPDPYAGQSSTQLLRLIADPVDEQILHMVSSDGLRTPTFTVFANPDVFVVSSDNNCPSTSVPVCIDYHTAWNHGAVAPDIANTWIGMVGPGVRQGGQDDLTWADHTDARPTLMTLVGLKDDYHEDGRVLIPMLEDRILPDGLRTQRDSVGMLGDVYKQLNAPFGPFDQQSLQVSTAALIGGSETDDSQYAFLESQLSELGSRRDSVAGRIRDELFAAEFEGGAIGDEQVQADLADAQELLGKMSALAAQ